ncbi:MAG TPA: flavin reductase family protein, partial [Candidatus Polarisedimenticolia bacterium]|nr:flavin reductase family protein [Candidatus Polarisedimenticolia bacterium]
LALSLGSGSVTRRNLEDRGEFVVNVPPRRLASETHFCGQVSGRDVRKERETGLRLEPAGKVRAPLLSDCIGHLECVVRDARPVGDQILFLAEVVLALAESGLFDETWNTDDERARTLHHLGGDAYTSSGRRVIIAPERAISW